MKKMHCYEKKKTRIAAVLLCMVMLCAVVFPLSAFAQEGERKAVRVGWHEPPYFMTDETGRRTGYSYEYQRKVAAYTGWRYEYVEGTWSDLLQMLKDGEIDLLSDVSYTEERAQDMLYPSLSMGTEVYYLFISPDNAEISPDDFSTLNGKKVGVKKSTIQADLFRQWAERNGVQPVIVELNTTEEEALKELQTDLDAFVTMDVFDTAETALPICKIGSSDFYFAVNKSRPDLLTDLNAALSRIRDENKFYNQELHEKYLSSSVANRMISDEESEWLLSHGVIRVGYQDNYLAFCAMDPATGELMGALRDFLDQASSVLEKTHITFEAVAFPSAGAAMEALKNGEIDCVFPANLTMYDSEMLGVVMTAPLMRTEMDAVVRETEQKEFIRKKQVTVAVNEGNTNYDLFLAEHYPTWDRAYYPDTPTGLDAVAAGEADCVIISNYRFNNISKQCDKLHLTTVYTGVDMDYCFAVREGDTALYSLLNRVVKAVPDATVHSALTYYSTEDVKTTFTDIIKDNLFIVMTVIASILLIILLLMVHSIRAEKKAAAEEHLVRDLNKKVFVDALTSVRNKGGFDEYMNGVQERVDKGELKEYGIGIFDCDDLKTINDQNGHDKGDIYLKTASRLICRIFQHSPVFRIGGDEFAIFLQNDDFKNRDALVKEFEEARKEICTSAENTWDQVHIALGIAVYDPEMDQSVNDTMRRADKIMYENKRQAKRERR